MDILSKIMYEIKMNCYGEEDLIKKIIEFGKSREEAINFIKKLMEEGYIIKLKGYYEVV